MVDVELASIATTSTQAGLLFASDDTSDYNFELSLFQLQSTRCLAMYSRHQAFRQIVKRGPWNFFLALLGQLGLLLPLLFSRVFCLVILKSWWAKIWNFQSVHHKVQVQHYPHRFLAPFPNNVLKRFLLLVIKLLPFSFFLSFPCPPAVAPNLATRSTWGLEILAWNKSVDSSVTK